MAQECQPEAASPPSREALRRRLVEMKRLRIEFARKGDDLLRRHGIGAEGDLLAFG